MKFGNYPRPVWMGHTATTPSENPAPAGQPASSRLPAPEAYSPPPSLENRNATLANKAKRFFRPDKNFNDPAIQLKGEWNPNEPASAPDITTKGKKVKDKGKAKQVSTAEPFPLAATDELAARWFLDEMQRQSNEGGKCLAVSGMRALEHERKNIATIPNDQRILRNDGGHLGKVLGLAAPILPKAFIHSREEKAHKATYHGEVVNYTLHAAGENDTEAFLKSAIKATPGAAHRHGSTMLNATAGLVGAARNAAPDLVAKAALSGVRLALSTVSAAQALNSWDQKLENSQSEDIMARVRFDDPPSAKVAGDALQASHEVLTELWTVQKTIRQLETADGNVEAARAALQLRPDDPASQAALEAAESKRRFAKARLNFQIKVKSDYKVTSETAKVEYIGNKSYIKMTLANAGVGGTAGGLGFLSSFAAASVATKGAAAGLAGLALGIYLIYVFRMVPDLQNKSLRGAIALAKSRDLLNDERFELHEAYAEVHAEYLRTRREIKRRPQAPEEKALRLQLLKQTVDRDLRKLEEKENNLKPAISQEENWRNYRDFVREIENLPPEEVAAAVEGYVEAHRDEMRPDVLEKASKTVVGMRVDSGRKLFTGEIARAKEDTVNLDKARVIKDFLRLGIKPEDKEARRAELRDEMAHAIADGLNLEAAQNAVNHAVRQNGDGDAMNNSLEDCSRLLRGISDPDFRTLFKGDGEEQTKAAAKARRLIAAEVDRHKWTNIGGVAVGAAIVTAVGAVDFGIDLAKALPPDTPMPGGHDAASASQQPDPRNVGRYHGLAVADYQLLRVFYPVGAALGAHNNSAARHTVRDVQAKRVTNMVVKAAKKAFHKEAAKDGKDKDAAVTMPTATDNIAPQDVTDVSEADVQATPRPDETENPSDAGTVVNHVEAEAETAAEAVVASAETAHPLETLEFTLDWPRRGAAFQAEDMAEIVEALMQHRNLPKTLTIKFRSDNAVPAEDAGTSRHPAHADIPALAEVKFDLGSTVPFRQLLIKEARTKDRAKVKYEVAKILGRQMAITVLGVPMQTLAQIPLKLSPTLEAMKKARNDRSQGTVTDQDSLSTVDLAPETDGEQELIPLQRIPSSTLPAILEEEEETRNDPEVAPPLVVPPSKSSQRRTATSEISTLPAPRRLRTARPAATDEIEVSTTTSAPPIPEKSPPISAMTRLPRAAMAEATKVTASTSSIPAETTSPSVGVTRRQEIVPPLMSGALLNTEDATEQGRLVRTPSPEIITLLPEDTVPPLVDATQKQAASPMSLMRRLAQRVGLRPAAGGETASTAAEPAAAPREPNKLGKTPPVAFMPRPSAATTSTVTQHENAVPQIPPRTSSLGGVTPRGPAQTAPLMRRADMQPTVEDVEDEAFAARRRTTDLADEALAPLIEAVEAGVEAGVESATVSATAKN